MTLKSLLEDIRTCDVCQKHLSHQVRPVVRARSSARILVIGQAPGTRVHKTGIPWNDPSGIRLREWMNIDQDVFYDESQIAIVPMGFCYPGKGKSGDLPPRRECAPLWHAKVFQVLPHIELTLLIGQYSQRYYLKDREKTLTETVRAWQQYMPRYLPLPHPSPRNFMWLKKNTWFEREVIPYLRKSVKRILK